MQAKQVTTKVVSFKQVSVGDPNDPDTKQTAVFVKKVQKSQKAMSSRSSGPPPANEPAPQQSFDMQKFDDFLGSRKNVTGPTAGSNTQAPLPNQAA